jgi:hypothetical protein
MNWKRLSCLLLLIAAVLPLVRQPHLTFEMALLHRYSQVVGGMTVEQVREVMGRGEDRPNERKTTTGEFARSWTFAGGIRLTFVFSKDGKVTYKELAPSYCGVSPLMAKYVKE